MNCVFMPPLKSMVMLLCATIGFASLINAEEIAEVLTSESGAAPSSDSSSYVDVYYFYFQPRCQTCIDIELFTKEAVEAGFPEELRQGRIRWHAYDVDVKEFEHFWYDFELETKSVILVSNADGKQSKWKNCDRVWDLVLDKPAFIKYVQDEVRAYLIN